ncbi:MAG: AbgT family transporter [Gammaproteobacteria bacterium]
MKILERVERLGNRLPDPATLFFIGTVFVILLSALAAGLDWSVRSDIAGRFEAKSLLSSDGIWWLTSHLVENFIQFPPLAIVLVGMLGIGVAEASGLLPALLRHVILRIPDSLLSPATVFLGIMSSIALDAGYVVLPPIAAALYQAAGRSPLAGIAAAFAGVSAGFSANLSITALDPLLSGLSQSGARILVEDYQVAVTANWWFMIVSTVVLTLVGWLVTDRIVEPAQSRPLERPGPPASPSEETDTASMNRGLKFALLAFLISFGVVLLAILVPGAPLFGEGDYFARWVEATIPLLFLLLLIPGIFYGFAAGTIQNDRDVARMMGETMARMGPYIVLAFFAAQFIECFKYSGLGEMLAIGGGQWLTHWQIPTSLLLIGFILMTMLANLLIGSASAKYAFFAPVFVPMFMQVGISPELTQAAYRVGDSISNTITPLNPYMVIMLAHMQYYARRSGLGTLIAMMLPYTLAFALVWILLLVLWIILGPPLGPGGGLEIPLPGK